MLSELVESTLHSVCIIYGECLCAQASKKTLHTQGESVCNLDLKRLNKDDNYVLAMQRFLKFLTSD